MRAKFQLIAPPKKLGPDGPGAELNQMCLCHDIDIISLRLGVFLLGFRAAATFVRRLVKCLSQSEGLNVSQTAQKQAPESICVWSLLFIRDLTYICRNLPVLSGR